MIDQNRTNVRFRQPRERSRLTRATGAPEHRPAMRSHRRPARGRVRSSALVADAAPRAALGNHGGREIGSLFTCDRPVTPPRCTSVGDGLTHRVAFDASLTDGLADSLRQAMAEAYDEPTKLTMIVQSTVSDDTDAIAFSDDYGENGAAGWVYCPADAPQGVNPSGDRWCRHQEIHFNLNPRYAALLRRRRQSRPRDLPRARPHARPPPLGQPAADRGHGSRRDVHEREHPGRPDAPAPVRHRPHQRVRLPARPAPVEREWAARASRDSCRGAASSPRPRWSRSPRPWARWSPRPTRSCAAGSSPWCRVGSSAAATTVRCTTHRPRSRSRPSSPARCRRRIGPA